MIGLHKMIVRSGLQYRFFSRLTAVITLTLLVFTVVYIGLSSRAAQDNLQQKAIDLTTLSLKSLSSALWQYNLEYLEEYLASLSEYEDVIYASVVLESGGTVVKVRPGYGDLPGQQQLDLTDVIMQSRAIIYNGKELGVFTIGISTERISQQVFYSSLVAILLLMLLIFLTFLTVWFFSRRYIFAPLNSLERSAELIAAGDLDTPITTEAKGEIGSLAETLRKMIASLKEITASRDELNREIEHRKQAEQERNQLQVRLMQAQKMESIGNLAGGIAHDFNNILASILGFTELSLDHVRKDSEVYENLQQVLRAGLRAKDLVKQILAFARQSGEERRAVRVDEIIQEAVTFIRSSTPVSIDIVTVISSSSCVYANPTQLHQVLMNLFTNGAQAMEQSGGTLTVRAIDERISETESEIDIPPNDYVRITVEDTGTGIQPEILKLIFEPYFTTKGLAEGSGLGLAVAQGIVESCGGMITVESSIGQGTCFNIFLPVSSTTTVADEPVAAELPGGTERILLVDDEPAIVHMLHVSLERLGYQVVSYTSSLKALESFCANPDSFDLVLSDATMPNLSGDKLAEQVLRIRPDLPVILCTGYSRKINEEVAARIGIAAFVYKPVGKAEIAGVVREVLDMPAASLESGECVIPS